MKDFKITLEIVVESIWKAHANWSSQVNSLDILKTVAFEYSVYDQNVLILNRVFIEMYLDTDLEFNFYVWGIRES